MPTTDECIEKMAHICYDLLDTIQQHELTGQHYNQLLHHLATENFNGYGASLGRVIHWTLQDCGMFYNASSKNGKDTSKVRVTNRARLTDIRKLLQKQEPTIRGRLQRH